MANSWFDDDAWEGDYFDSQAGTPVNDILFGGNDVVDMHAQELFRDAFFNNDDRAYMDLVDYMWEEYGMDFEDAFTWEDFRDWYDAR